MNQRIYKRLLNSLVTDIKCDSCMYAYKVSLDFHNHVSYINILPIGRYITGTCIDVVITICKRHSLDFDFGCIIRDDRPCFLVTVYNI